MVIRDIGQGRGYGTKEDLEVGGQKTGLARVEKTSQ